ncbi:MAG: holo-ACP synthase [candidate division FCPU426 bacterium]
MVIGVGLDIQEIARLERAIERSGAAFLRKTFTPAEIAYCRRQKRSGQHFCGRFCAKEAFFKALGTGWARGVKWTEVEVVRNRTGRPQLRLSGRAQELSRRAGVKRNWLSLSHSYGYAAATVVLEG